MQAASPLCNAENAKLDLLPQSVFCENAVVVVSGWNRTQYWLQALQQDASSFLLVRFNVS